MHDREMPARKPVLKSEGRSQTLAAKEQVARAGQFTVVAWRWCHFGPKPRDYEIKMNQKSGVHCGPPF